MSVIENCYSFNQNIYIKSVEYDDLKYTVVIEIEDYELVIAGLDEVFVEEGLSYDTNHKIGIDRTINSFLTKYVIFVYSDLNVFPQFQNNKLLYKVNRGTKIYSVSDCKVSYIATTIIKGNNIVTEINKDDIYFCEYWNLSSTRVYNNENINRGLLLGYTGNTGSCIDPQMILKLNSLFDEYDFKVIYVKK